MRLLRAIRRELRLLLDALPRPLDPIPSIKMKLGFLVVASGLAGLSYFWLVIGRIPPTTSAIAIGLSLFTSQVLANGMTSPLRQMTAAARAMARGDYTRRVRTTSRDEVGALARAFNQMNGDLEAADRQRRELIANVSHELRTPISALQGLLENLVDGVAVADPDTLRVALAQTERLGRLVSELLDLSRIEAGAARLDREEFAVGPFLTEAIREAEIRSARAVTFRSEVGPVDAAGYGDRERLHQIMANLLDNAVRHSPPSGVVTVTGRQGADRLVFEVADEGSGIPVEERTRVFDRFTRGGRAGSWDGGTGLGLAIARWVVELHEGTIAVVDSPTGCRIRVTIPAAPPG